ncbi:MAG: tRNA (adenosine(37)-N6)-threonylcarbamoyltransferase complex dimerization subunit type 1 TsaB [Defluviitaleaceae bacterium]|nr:tRNA (adenosine(37)-N6)-threonylcarbamoyltransferase complex dimerization subunit type 1 TsaB [Defluviitaleaceae bacterium]
MKILAIDTSGGTCSVALVNNKGIIGEYTVNNGLTHSVNLMPVIDNLLTSTNHKLNQIERIALSTGPGSFTGLRIGAACAKALAHSQNIGVIEVPTTDALAYNIMEEKSLIVPIMDARREQVYTAYYARDGSLQRISDYLVMDIHKVVAEASRIVSQKGLNRAIFLGDGVEVYGSFLGEHSIAPPTMMLQRAAGVGMLAVGSPPQKYSDVQIFYIRKPQAVRELDQIKIVPFSREHIDKVHAIELATFSDPWSKAGFIADIDNPLCTYLVALKQNEPIGYIGMWHVADEGHITNIAIAPKHRQEGNAIRLLNALEEIAKQKDIRGLTLEVRASNTMAKNLYQKLGFIQEGIRKNYYKKPQEDALILWKYISEGYK